MSCFIRSHKVDGEVDRELGDIILPLNGDTRASGQRNQGPLGPCPVDAPRLRLGAGCLTVDFQEYRLAHRILPQPHLAGGVRS